MRVLLYAAEWFHPIDGSVRQLSGKYPHFFLQKKMRVLLYAAEWFHPIDGSVWQLSGEYPHFFLQVLGVPSSFFALQGGGQFFFVSANLPIPTNWTSNSRSPGGCAMGRRCAESKQNIKCGTSTRMRSYQNEVMRFYITYFLIYCNEVLHNVLSDLL